MTGSACPYDECCLAVCDPALEAEVGDNGDIHARPMYEVLPMTHGSGDAASWPEPNHIHDLDRRFFS